MSRPFEEWALLELFGHTRIAGLVTEAELAGGKFIRVDVPEMPGVQALTRFIGPSAVYSITPLEKATARAMAANIKAAPITSWDARQLALSENSTTVDPEEGSGEEE